MDLRISPVDRIHIQGLVDRKTVRSSASLSVRRDDPYLTVFGRGFCQPAKPGGLDEWPGRVVKNRPMPGQLGNEQVTVQNLEVVAIDEARNLIMVRGGVPGYDGAIVLVNDAKKRAKQVVGPVPAGLKAQASEAKKEEVKTEPVAEAAAPVETEVKAEPVVETVAPAETEVKE